MASPLSKARVLAGVGVCVGLLLIVLFTATRGGSETATETAGSGTSPATTPSTVVLDTTTSTSNVSATAVPTTRAATVSSTAVPTTTVPTTKPTTKVVMTAAPTTPPTPPTTSPATAPPTTPATTAAPTEPGAPTNVYTYYNGVYGCSVYVYFSPPTSDGGSPITSYTVSGGNGASGGAGVIYVTVAADGTYSFTVRATNAVGTGPPSAAAGATVNNC
ncbi:MAG: hypothetical protein HY826_09440 [Actinobacteria bacterium]|nr:hypothetical protein [Actinomycetota bacterium]